MKLITSINEETLQDFINLSVGLYNPLKGFMTSLDYHNVVDEMILSDKSVWTIPVTIDVPHEVFEKAIDADKLWCEYEGKDVGYVEIDDCYRVDLKKDVVKIFGTDDTNHPGVAKEFSRTKYRIGGKVVLVDETLLEGMLMPSYTKEIFSKNEWQTVVGFQTRNPIHRAHEYLQRTALELCDGLFINPLTGWKKKGDFSQEAVMNGYNRMVKDFYPEGRVFLAELKTSMRYAGPREAIFHALIRRNLGCTHFIIGRDHAGVGGYYDKYAAHNLAEEIRDKHMLGIELLLLKGPFYCSKCEHIATEKTCSHRDDIVEISGTDIRKMLSEGKYPDKRFMRKEVADEIIELKEDMFIR